MSTPISFSGVEKMLRHCAPGHTIKLKTHYRIVMWKGKTYHSLPKTKTMEVGHVRSMVRLFRIMECAKEQLPKLFPK